jgi:hypothetical protein
MAAVILLASAHNQRYSAVMARWWVVVLFAVCAARGNGILAQGLDRVGEEGYAASVAIHSHSQEKSFHGVAATLFLGSPKWFQQRYSLMVNQMKASLPASWVIQIFYIPGNRMSMEAINYQGIQRRVTSGDVFLTPTPPSFGKKVKRKELLKMPWFWRSLLADRVLLFGGNSVLCSNSPHSLQDFEQYDYVGAQWHYHRGQGGSGELSLRNRLAVLAFIESHGGDEYGTLVKDPEDIALVKGLTNVAPREVQFLPGPASALFEDHSL